MHARPLHKPATCGYLTHTHNNHRLRLHRPGAMVRDAFFAEPGETQPAPLRPSRGRGASRVSPRGRLRGGRRAGGPGAPPALDRGRPPPRFPPAHGAPRGSRRGARSGPSFSSRPDPSAKSAPRSEHSDAHPAKRMRPSSSSTRPALPSGGKPAGKARTGHRQKKDAHEDEDEASAQPISTFDKDALDLSSHHLPAWDDLTGTLAHFARLRKLNLSSIEPSEEHPQGLDDLSWLHKAVVKSKALARKAAQKEDAAGPGTTRDRWFGHDLTTLTLAGNHGLGDAHASHGEEVFSTIMAFPSVFGTLERAVLSCALVFVSESMYMCMCLWWRVARRVLRRASACTCNSLRHRHATRAFSRACSFPTRPCVFLAFLGGRKH